MRQYEGTIEADRGALDNAKLQLSYTKIRAPVSGRTGLRQVDAGNMVKQADTNGIVVITEIDPIDVVFSIAEDKLAAVRKRTQGGGAMSVDAFDRDGKVKLASGRLLTIDNQIDPTTGTVKVKAEFGNADAALFPQQFVNVRMLVDTLKGATVVPTAAIQRGSVGAFVYRVNDDNTVSVKPVKLGPAEGEATVVESGVAPGERVVVDGLDKLKDGAQIEPIDRSVQAPATPRAAKGDGPRRKAGGEGKSGDATPNGIQVIQAAIPRAARGSLESVAPVHPAAGGDLADDGRRAARGPDRLSRAADRGAAGDRLPDDPGRHALPRREPGGDDVVGHRTARAPVRADAGAEPDVVDELGRRVGDHAAVQPRLDARRRRAGGAGRDQRGSEPAADRPAAAADLQQGQSGGRADPLARRVVGHDPAAEAATT